LGTSKVLQADSPGFIAHQASRVPKGFLVFMRKIANKMVEMAKSIEEIASFIESIPEWAEYTEGELKLVNEI